VPPKGSIRVSVSQSRLTPLIGQTLSADEEDRRRDLQTKRREYARAGIPEYWIIDPREERILVLRLAGKRYVLHGDFPKGTAASSHLLRGFTVDVEAALANQIPTRRKRKPRR
jgi:Uma2 family endonuclease